MKTFVCSWNVSLDVYLSGEAHSEVSHGSETTKDPRPRAV